MTAYSRSAARAALSPPANDGRDALEIATRHYFYKPMAAFFRSFELRAYFAAGAKLEPPVLDVGCGDGTFGRMLGEALGSGTRLSGIDLDQGAVRRGQRVSRDRYEQLVCGSAESLPFETGAFRTIISNGSLGCGAGTDRGLDEIARVLAPGGSLYCTVPTTLFDRNYWLVRGLERLRFRGAARAYAGRMNRRMTHVCCLEPEQWHSRLAAHGLVVDRTIGFFPARLVTFWSVLAATPLRIAGVLSVPPFRFLAAAAGAAQWRLFERTYRRTPVPAPADASTYVLIHAIRDAGQQTRRGGTRPMSG